jgi:hypothetical protein
LGGRSRKIATSRSAGLYSKTLSKGKKKQKKKSGRKVKNLKVAKIVHNWNSQTLLRNYICTTLENPSPSATNIKDTHTL